MYLKEGEGGNQKVCHDLGNFLLILDYKAVFYLLESITMLL